jgi:hypothetical protein
MISDAEQGIGVRGQIDPDDIGLFVDDMVNEAGILVRKAVMVLPPDMGRE